MSSKFVKLLKEHTSINHDFIDEFLVNFNYKDDDTQTL